MPFRHRPLNFMLRDYTGKPTRWPEKYIRSLKVSMEEQVSRFKEYNSSGVMSLSELLTVDEFLALIPMTAMLKYSRKVNFDDYRDVVPCVNFRKGNYFKLDDTITLEHVERAYFPSGSTEIKLGEGPDNTPIWLDTADKKAFIHRCGFDSLDEFWTFIDRSKSNRRGLYIVYWRAHEYGVDSTYEGKVKNLNYYKM